MMAELADLECAKSYLKRSFLNLVDLIVGKVAQAIQAVGHPVMSDLLCNWRFKLNLAISIFLCGALFCTSSF